MEDLRAWLRQPTTIAGVSALIATLSALLIKQIAWPQAIPILVGSAVSMLLPDNTDARQQAQQIAGELVATIDSRTEAAQ